MNSSAPTPTGTGAKVTAASNSPMLANTGANLELAIAALLLLAGGMIIMLVLARRRKA
ncbi:hypothetical protein [Arthrobacter sp. Leaf337]|uniref:hypothetical protein n=1 Tax=Arthrobacter sp. Leaf337 TaxID=1736342 RepID=UPI000AB49297|nr:hypothetical protein [Arthrobacter sp. Leaf337]